MHLINYQFSPSCLQSNKCTSSLMNAITKFRKDQGDNARSESTHTYIIITWTQLWYNCISDWILTSSCMLLPRLVLHCCKQQHVQPMNQKISQSSDSLLAIRCLSQLGQMKDKITLQQRCWMTRLLLNIPACTLPNLYCYCHTLHTSSPSVMTEIIN